MNPKRLASPEQRTFVTTTPGSDATRKPTPRGGQAPSHADHTLPRNSATWHAVNTARSRATPFAQQPPPTGGHTQPEPPSSPRSGAGLQPRKQRAQASLAWKQLLQGRPPWLKQSGSAQAPHFEFTQHSVPEALHGALCEACADAWSHNPAAGLALLSAVCEGLDAPVLWASLLQAHAAALLAAGPTLSARAFHAVLSALDSLAGQGLCELGHAHHIAPAARESLQALAALHEPALARRLALAEVEQRLRDAEPSTLKAQDRLDLLSTLRALADQLLSAQDVALARRLWVLVERVALGLPQADTGVDALSRELVDSLRARLAQALQQAMGAGLGPWIGLELQVPMEPDHSTLGAIRLQSPTSAESREAALAELQAWLKAQLSLPPARRALSWAELHQVIDHVAPLLGWQPAPADQLNWCLLQACNAHQVQPLLEGLKTLDPALVGTDDLRTLLTLSRDQALPQSERVELLCHAMRLLPPPAQAPHLHQQCVDTIQAIGDPEIRRRLQERFAEGPRPSRTTASKPRGNAPSHYVNRQLPPVLDGQVWRDKARALERRIQRHTTQPLAAKDAEALLARIKTLWQAAGPHIQPAQLDSLLACAEHLAQRLAPLSGGPASLLKSHCEGLRQRLRHSLRQACRSRLSEWLDVAPPPGGSGSDSGALWRVTRLDPQSRALASAEEREQAWGVFLRWLALEIGEKDGPNWPQAHALLTPVAHALQCEPEPADLLALRLRAALRAADAVGLCRLLLTEADTPLHDKVLLSELVRAALEASPEQADWAPLQKLLRQRLARHPDAEVHQSAAVQALKMREQEAKRAELALSRWLSIERKRDRSGQHGQLKARIAPHAQPPQDEDEFQLAQASLFNFMTRELLRPDGVGWAELMDLVSDVEAAWPQWPLDRQRLLGLCLCHAQQINDPKPLLPLLPKLAGEIVNEHILAALLEQARQPWSPLVRASLLQSIVRWLPEPTPAHESMHVQVLQTILVQEDPGARGSLLDLYRQRHLPDNSETGRLLRMLNDWKPDEQSTPEHLLSTLGSLERRERKAPREIWLALCRLLLERAVPALLALSRSKDASQAAAAADTLQRLIWRMSHARSGDKARPIDDQFALLQTVGQWLPPDSAVHAFDWLDQACCRLIQRKLQAGADKAPPMAALAMRGAITVLSAPHRKHPLTRPSPLGLPLADAVGHFFADWFRALSARPHAAGPRDGPDAELTRLIHTTQLLRLPENPQVKAAQSFMEALFRHHGLLGQE